MGVVSILWGIVALCWMVLALIPPLWFAVMNPRVRTYYAGEEHQLNAGQQAI